MSKKPSFEPAFSLSYILNCHHILIYSSLNIHFELKYHFSIFKKCMITKTAGAQKWLIPQNCRKIKISQNLKKCI